MSKSGGPTNTATRHGPYFFDSYPTGSPMASYATLTVSAPQDTPPSFALTSFHPGNESPGYDFDGNLTSDNRFNYTYDGENRLIWLETSMPAVMAGVPKTALQFGHDYLGRRVIKTRYSWNGSAWVQQVQERFLYHGWNIIAVGDSNLNITKNIFWGLDLSGSLAGAGGVGGLLMVQEGGNSYLPAYDAMGNVHGMIKASDGSLAAAYEYDAFGNTLRESGPYAASNPFRFATKYADTETGLVQYNTRYYSPTLGRFLNRDTISEQGGINLYAYCGNNGINRWDYLGMDPGNVAAGYWEPEFVEEYRRIYNGRNNYGHLGYGSSLGYDINGDDGYWVQAYSHDTDGFNGAADRMGIGSISDPRVGENITMAQATSILYNGSDGSHFYGSDVYTGANGGDRVNAGGQTLRLASAVGGYYGNPAGSDVSSSAVPAGRVNMPDLVVVEDEGLKQYPTNEPTARAPEFWTPEQAGTARGSVFDAQANRPYTKKELLMSVYDSFAQSKLDSAPMAMVRAGATITAGVTVGLVAAPVVSSGIEAWATLTPVAKIFIVSQAARIVAFEQGGSSGLGASARQTLANRVAAETAARVSADAIKAAGTPR